MDLQTELASVAKQLNQIIEQDTFPDTIQPEFLKNAVKSYPCRGGKRLRPALLLWTCGLFSGNVETAKYAAAAVEIYHNWTLVHDDIIDNDDFRRGQPTTHTELATFAEAQYSIDKNVASIFGRDFAILAGDIQQGWAINMVYKSLELGLSAELILTISRRLQELVNRELISGEALDIEFSYRHPADISVEEVETMLTGKTAILLQFCAETGAMIALNTTDPQHPTVKKAGEFAKLAGLAFQLRDDWLGIFGNAETFGKPICSDMSESKPTFLLISALTNLTGNDKECLEQLLGKADYSQDEIEQIRDLLRSSGAEKTNNEKAEKYGSQAKQILADLPENGYQTLLKEWCSYLIDRHI